MSLNTKKNQWSSRWGFLFAAIGFAVGLGNIWRFPYIAGVNGGSAFIFVYLLCVLCIGLPLLIAELSIGRKGRGSPSGSIRNICKLTGLSPRWSGVGTLAVFCVFILLSIYSVVTSWTLDYLVLSISGVFEGIGQPAAERIFENLLKSPARLIGWHSMVCLFVIIIIRQGVQTGIERAAKILLPVLLFAIVSLVFYGLMSGDMTSAVRFLFQPDFTKISFSILMVAIGQVFFSIGIGVAGMIAFGAYLPEEISIPESALIIVLADVLVALLAGLAIFPLVFFHGLETTSGPGLIFQTLPLAFGHMDGGKLFGAMFFLLIISAALTSCIGCGEALVSWAAEYWRIDRKYGVLIAVGGAWILGVLSILSLSAWSGFFPLGFISVFEGKALFQLLEFVASNILLLFGGFLTAIFFAWYVPSEISYESTGLKNRIIFLGWRFMLRYVIPPLLIISIVLGVSE